MRIGAHRGARAGGRGSEPGSGPHGTRGGLFWHHLVGVALLLLAAWAAVR